MVGREMQTQVQTCSKVLQQEQHLLVAGGSLEGPSSGS
jgi:hypothetical protein